MAKTTEVLIGSSPEVKAGASDADFWAKLTAPFPPDEIELLPKPFASGSPKGECNRPDRNGDHCGGYHGLPAVHLSYVGHAGLTMRLNDVCGPDGWEWEPLAVDEAGLPLLQNGGLWIRLWITTPSGKEVGKLGYGDAPGKSSATKELIGDALRNAAMRFGIGTYLWGKSDRAKATLERGDATAQGNGVEPESAQPEPTKPEPHPAIPGLAETISGLTAHQTEWLVRQWTLKGWPPLKTLPADAPESQVESIRVLIAEAQDQVADAPPF